MLQLTGGIGFRVYVGDLLHFQCAFQRHGVVGVASDVEHGVTGVVFLCQLRQRAVHVQRLLDLLRNGLKLTDQPYILLFRKKFHGMCRIHGEQIQHRKLRGISLCGGHRDLGTGPGIQGVVCQFRNGAAHHIDDGQRPGPEALAFFHGRNGIRRFTRLRENDQKRVAVDLGFTVSQLTGQLHIHRDMAQLFYRVFSRTPRVIRRAAGGDHDFSYTTKFLGCKAEIIQLDMAFMNSGCQSRLHGTGLLHDLFEHEMLITALFRRFDTPCDAADRLVNDRAGAIIDRDALRCQLRKLAVIQIQGVTGIGYQRRHVRGKEVFANTDTKDQRTGFPHRYDFPRTVGAENAEGIGACQSGSRSHDGFLKIPMVVHLDQMDDHFCIRLTAEGIAVCGQFLPQSHIILDDAVMNHRKPSVTAHVRMGIGIGRRSMGRPAGMTDAGKSGQSFSILRFLTEVRNSAAHFGYRDHTILRNRDPGRVISAVLQFFQSLQQNGSCILLTGKSNNSAHKPSCYRLIYASRSGPTDT